MGEFILRVGPRAQLFGVESDVVMELQTLFTPVLEPLLPLAGVTEELHFRLFEFSRSEREISRVDLVSKRLAHLRDPERDLLACRFANPLETVEQRLTGLRAEVGHQSVVFGGTDSGLEHQIENKLCVGPFDFVTGIGT